MKILFLNACINQIGGIERVTLDVVSGLVAKGYDISILSFAHKGNPNDTFGFDHRVKVFYTLNKWKHICFAPFYALKIRKQIKEINPDIIVYVDSLLYIFIAPFIRGLLRGKKEIVWEHFCYVLAKGKQKIRQWSRSLAGKKADAFVFLTERDKTFQEKKQPNFKARFLVIPNMVRGDILKKATDHETALLLRKKRVLFVGRLSPEKQIPKLIDIWHKLQGQEEEWILTIVGEGRERTLIEEKIKHYNLKNVELVGKTQNVDYYFSDSQIIVLTSQFEGLPLVLIEGLFYSLPAVSFNCPCGPGAIIKDNETGYLIECFDDDQFSKQILKLMKDDSLRERFSKSAEKETQKYLPEMILPQWEALFQQMGKEVLSNRSLK